MASKLSGFLAELKRRRVYHVAVVYAVVGFGVAQGAEYLLQMLEFPLEAAQFLLSHKEEFNEYILLKFLKVLATKGEAK